MAKIKSEPIPNSPPKLMTQKDIAREYGVPTRDILIWLQKGSNFPKPVQTIGVKRWFRRDDIARYFKDRPTDSAGQG